MAFYNKRISFLTGTLRTAFFVLIALTGISLSVQAQTVVGGAIGYKHDSGGLYSVYLKYFYPCDQFPHSGSQAKVKIITTSTEDSITLDLVDSGFVNPYCSDTFSCNGVNKYRYKYRLFKKQVDLSSGPWSVSDTLVFRYETSPAIDSAFYPTNCVVNGYLLTAYLDRSIGENTNTGGLSNDQLLTTLVNSPQYYAIPATDIADHDSLVFSISTWSGSALCSTLFTVHDPLGTGQPDTSANPPQGMYLNPRTGQMIFTPTVTGERIAWEYRVQDFRTDSTGKMRRVGYSNTQLITSTFEDTTNYSPLIGGPFTVTACPGENLSMIIQAIDSTSSGASAPDTLDLSWNEAVPGASFTMLDSGAGFKTGVLNWTPGEQHIGARPYMFRVQVRDNHCAIGAATSRVFQLRVAKPVMPVFSIDSLGCNRYAVQIRDTGSAFSLFRVSVLDSSGNETENVHFSASGLPHTVIPTDTVHIRDNGLFVIRFEVTNTDGCRKVVYDTLQIDSSFSIKIIRPYEYICPTIDTLFTQMDSADHTFFKFSWNYSGSDTLRFYPLDAHSFTTGIIDLSLQITDTRGCVTELKQKLKLFGFEKLDTAQKLHLVCHNNYHILRTTLDSASRPFQWNTGDSTQQINVLDGGMYRIHTRTDSGCYFSDSIVLDPTPIPSIQISDNDSICMGDTIYAQLASSVYQNISWNTGSNSTYTLPNNSKTEYYVNVTATSACVFSDTAEQIYHHIQIKTGFMEDSTISCDGDSVFIRALQSGVIGVDVLWNTGDTTSNIKVVNPGIYAYKATDGHCQVSDSTRLVVISSPDATLPDTILVCPDYPTVITAPFNTGPETVHYWNGIKGGNKFVVDTQNVVYLRITKAGVCEGVDTALVKHLPRISHGFDHPNDSLCEGDTLTIGPDLLISGFKVLWNTGDTTEAIKTNTGGRYTIRVISSEGCVFRDTVDVTLYANPANVNLGPDRLVCESSNLVLSVSPGHNESNFLWSDSSTGKTMSTTTAGLYWVRVTNQQGCSASDTMNLSKKPALPTLPVQNYDLCFGDSIHLDMTAADSVVWTLPDGTKIDTNYLIISYLNDGRTDYEVVDTSFGLKCRDLGSVTINYQGAGQVFGKLLSNTLIPVRNETVQLVQISNDQPVVIGELVTDNSGEFNFGVGCPDSVVVRGKTNPGQFKAYSPKTVDINKADFIDIQPGGVESQQVIMQNKPAAGGTGTVAGMIRDSVTGQPVDGLEVILVNAVSENPVGIDTTTEGRFSFEQVANGSYAVFVDQWKFINQTTDIIPVNQVTSYYDTLLFTKSDRYLHLQNTLGVAGGNAGFNRVYPNPATGRVFIETTGRATGIAVYSADGSIMYEGMADETIVEISVTGWSSGVYFLQLSSDDGALFFTRLVVISNY